jgi:hypothetical protein
VANDMVPTKRPGEDITGQATAAVTGKRFVRISGARAFRFNVLATTADGNNYKVAPATAGGAAVGVAKYDQPTVGGKVGVARGGFVIVTAGAAITAGQFIMSDATGQAVPWTSAASEANAKLGYAVDDAANGADAEIAINLG